MLSAPATIPATNDTTLRPAFAPLSRGTLRCPSASAPSRHRWARATTGNKTEDLGGKAKEATGNITGDDNLKNEGKGDQAKAGLKGAVENVKDAVGDVADKAKGSGNE